MNTTASVKSTAEGLRWSASRNVIAIHAARRDRPLEGAGSRHDQRKMPNGDPPPATLWGTDSGE
jgi:hypothetical protein